MKKQNNSLDEAINALKNESVSTNPPQEVFEATLQKLTQVGQEPKPTNIKKRTKIMERIKAMKSFTKLAAAAMIIIAAVLSITLLDKSVTPAYAIEQTIEASHTVRYLHIKDFKVNENEPKEFWVEFDQTGQVRNVRMHMPEWDAPEDGAKEIVWKENKAKVWLKKKNVLATIRDKTVAAHMLKFIEELDPRLAVERLREREMEGKVKLEIEEPSDKAEPIVVTATYLPESSTPSRRFVLFVDQATKLVTTLESYHLTKNGDYKLIGWTEFYDYNQHIDPAMFVLDEIPSDVMQIDQTTQDIGLEQGGLSDKEIAVKVVREFYEALIVKDYAKAGQIYSGVPAAKMQERWQNVSVLRIVSISEPIPHPYPGVGGFQVHCEIEIEKDGVKSILKPYGPGVRPVHGQPSRWGIHGGVK